VDSRNCQTVTVTPAEPGVYLFVIKLSLDLDRFRIFRCRIETVCCADVVLSTRYHLEEKLRKAKSMNIRVVVHDGSGNKVGEFTLKIRQ